MTYVRWFQDKDNLDPKFVVSKLKDEVKILPNGIQMSGKSLILGDPFILLSTSMVFTNYVSEADKRFILKNGLRNAARDPDYDERTLLKEVNKEAHRFFSSQLQKFVLVTRLSSEYFENIARADGFGSRARVDELGSRIYIGKQLPKRFRKARKEAIERLRSLRGGRHSEIETSNRLSHIWVHVQARTVEEAVDVASRALDLRLGIWNFLINRNTLVPFLTGGSNLPVNVLNTGPFFSLHSATGQLASESDWVNPDYPDNTTVVSCTYAFRRKWTEIQSSEQGIKKCLEKSLYRNVLEEAFRKYCQALDTVDSSVSLIRLWSLLEHLTNVGAKDSHEKVVDRISFTFAEKERTEHKHILHHLRRYRNNYVHKAEGSSQADTYVHQLRIYTDHFLTFHLMNVHKFDSIEHVAEYLDISPEKSDIESIIRKEKLDQERSLRRQKLALKALSFHHKSP